CLGDRRVRVRLRRHLYRRDLDARHAQPDARVFDHLSRRLVAAAAIRQYRPVDLDPHFPRRARRAAGGALSGAGESDLQIAVRVRKQPALGLDPRVESGFPYTTGACVNDYFGHGSAVTVAASMPTRSASAIGFASFSSSRIAALISATSPTP